MTEVTSPALAAHPFLRGMPPAHLDALAEVGADVCFPAGHRIFDDGGFAGKFWLIQSGHVALDMQVPGEGRVAIDTVGMGEMLGCSRRTSGRSARYAPDRCEPSNSTRSPSGRGVRPTRSWATSSTGGYFRVFAGRLQSTRTRLITRSIARNAGSAAAGDA